MSRLTLQTTECILDRVQSVRRELPDRCEQVSLVPRIDHDVPTLHEVVQPGAVVKWIHATPAVQENDDRRGARPGRVGFENPILLPAFAIAIFCYPSMQVLFPARTSLRLRGWSGTLGRDNSQREKYDG